MATNHVRARVSQSQKKKKNEDDLAVAKNTSSPFRLLGT